MERHPIQLPSMGILYGGAIPEGKITISPWTTEQEELLVRYSDNRTDELIDLLVQSSAQLQGLPYDDLLLTDRLFILFQLRMLSLTAHYTIDRKCSNCGFLFEVHTNLQELRVKIPDAGVEVVEPFECYLPKRKKKLHLRLLRVRDDKAIQRYENDRLKLASEKGDPATRLRYVRMIEQIDGKPAKFEDKFDFVCQPPLVMLDLAVIDRTIEKYETGLDLSIETQCPKCNISGRWAVPLTAGFFRPRESDIDREIALARGASEGDGLRRVEGVQLRSGSDDGVVAAAPDRAAPRRAG